MGWRHDGQRGTGAAGICAGGGVSAGYRVPGAVRGVAGGGAGRGRGLWAKAAQTPVAGHELVQITGMQRDGAISPNEPDEWVEITNQGTVAQDLTGWHLDSERGAASGQVFHFPSGLVMQPGQVCRVYTDEVHPE